jgi:hypothetical protein
MPEITVLRYPPVHGSAEERRMSPTFNDALAKVSEGTFEAVPKSLTTLWTYFTKGPRRLFLQAELSPERYMNPWAFLLANASIGASLAVLVQESMTSEKTVQASAYRDWFEISLFCDLLFVPVGLIIAWLLVQRVSIRAVLSAFAYASAWRPLTLPALAYILLAADGNSGSEYVGLPALAVLFAYEAFLIVGMAAHSYIEGPYRRSFLILTFALGSFCSLSILFASLPTPAAWRTLLASIAENTNGTPHRATAHCDNTVLEGTVQARGYDTLVWFEWGETPALGQHTPMRRYVDDGPAFEPLVNLHEHTTYYYRIAVKSTYGVSFGETASFITADCYKPISVPGDLSGMHTEKAPPIVTP